MAATTPTPTTPREQADRRRQRSASQRASTLRRLLAVWSMGVLGLFVIGTQDRVPVEALLLDASVVGGGHWYSGLVTSLGAVIWTIAATSAFAAAYVSWLVGRRGAAVTMAFGGGIVTLLLLDDLFLLHSDLVPQLTGLPKMGLVLIEAGAVGVWVLSCGRELARTRWELLVAAQSGFGGSLLIDQWLGGDGVERLIFEDGAKLLGVLALAAWAVSTATDLARSAVQSRT